MSRILVFNEVRLMGPIGYSEPLLWGHAMMPSPAPGGYVLPPAEWVEGRTKEVDTVPLLTPEQLKQCIGENHLPTAEDVQQALKAVCAETLQAMLEGELNSHLGYEKYAMDHKQTPNSRDGRLKKTLSTQYGDAELTIPRDRQGTFEPVVVPKYQTTMPGIEDQIVALDDSGITTRDSQAQLQDLCGI